MLMTKYKHIICEAWMHDVIAKIVKEYRYRGQSHYLEEVLRKDKKFKQSMGELGHE